MIAYKIYSSAIYFIFFVSFEWNIFLFCSIYHLLLFVLILSSLIISIPPLLRMSPFEAAFLRITNLPQHSAGMTPQTSQAKPLPVKNNWHMLPAPRYY